MKKYSIKDIERMTGIKAHTIRMWEKRHDIVTPERTDTNIRYYSDNDLKRLINVANLNQLGYKISYLASLDDQELARLTLSLMAQPALTDESDINNMMSAILTYDHQLFDKQLNNQLLKYGMEKSFKDVVAGFLDNTYYLYRSGVLTYPQLYFARSLIMSKFVAATDQLTFPANSEQSCILFVLDYHEKQLELLFYNYMLRKRGIKTYFFGNPISVDDLLILCQTIQPTLLIESFFETRDQDIILSHIDMISKSCSTYNIWIQAKTELDKEHALPENISYFSSVPTMIEHIARTFPYYD